MKTSKGLMRGAFAVFTALIIAGCGGGGGGGDGRSAGISKLYVGDSVNHAIGALNNPNPQPGVITVDRILNTGTEVNGLSLDTARDRLYVATGSSIMIISNAGTAQGTVSSTPGAFLASTGNFNSVSIDSAKDILYVSDRPNGIRVFSNASSMAFATPVRTFIDAGTFNWSSAGVSVDAARDIAYVLLTYDPAGNAVYVYENASTISGNVAPNRVITLSANAQLSGLSIDSTNNRLYVGTAGSQVHVFDNASTTNGAVIPTRTILFPGGPSSFTNVAIDSVADRLFAVTGPSGFILNNASTANGSAPAVQIDAGSGGKFASVAVRP